MAIRIEHQPAGAAVGAAAFAAGAGKAQQRKRKYQMDLFRDNQRLQARRQDMTAGLRYRTLLEGFREQNVQRRHDVTQLGLKGRSDATQLGLKDRATAMQGRFVATQDRGAREATADNLSGLVPEWAGRVERRNLLLRASELQAALLGRDIDFDDPEQAAAIQAEIDAFKARIGALEPPDPNAGGLVFDPETKRYIDTP